MEVAQENRNGQLEEAYSAFTSTARDLEKAYQELKLHALTLDLKLHEANQQLSAVFSALPEGIVHADPTGMVHTINPAAGRILDIATEGIPGKTRVAAFLDRHQVPLFLPSQGPEDRELEGTDGPVRVRIRYLPLSPELGALWIIEDRTELERLEGQVAHLDQLAGLGRMALSIAHEIRNPLNAVAGFAGLLERRLEDEKDLHYSKRIVEGVRRVDGIINNLLAFARPCRLTLRPTDLSLVVTTTLGEWEGGRVETKLPAKLARVNGDAIAFRQVLENLLRNSYEAGGAEINILVSLEEKGGSWILAVEDDGPGIPPEMRESVFEPFNSGKERGTGLGLAIILRIVEMHHGRVRAVAPQTLGGARIEIVLPAGGADVR